MRIACLPRVWLLLAATSESYLSGHLDGDGRQLMYCLGGCLSCAVQGCLSTGAGIVVEHVAPVMTFSSIHVRPCLHTAAFGKHTFIIMKSTPVVLAALSVVFSTDC